MNSDSPKSPPSRIGILIVFLALILSVIGALGYCGLRDVKIAITQQADQARENSQNDRDALIAAQRAYIFGTETQILTGGANNEQTQIIPKWENVGNTPANPVILEVRCPIMVEKNQEIPKQQLDTTTAGQQLQAPSQPISRLKALFAPKQAMPGGACIFSKEQLVLLLPSQPHLFLTARAIYRDAFTGTPLRITEYCSDTTLAKGPDNKLMFRTNLCDKFNCADNQCPQSERDEVEKEFGKM